MQVRMDPKTYAEHWEKESTLFESKGIYKRLSEITPNGDVLEIGSSNPNLLPGQPIAKLVSVLAKRKGI